MCTIVKGITILLVVGSSNEYAGSVFFALSHDPLFRPSHRLGRYVGPGLFDPETEKRVIVTSHRSSMVGKKLYCGNLSYNVSSSDLEQLFSQFGSVVSAQVIQDRDSGRSKGFGFVEMDDDADAASAIEALDGTEHEGRSIKVNEAKPREPRRGGGGYGGGGGGGYGGGGGRRGGRY